jgi:hypothetical protein
MVVPPATDRAPAHAGGAPPPPTVAPSDIVHAPALTRLAYLRGPTQNLFAQPSPLPLGTPAAAAPFAVDTLTLGRRSAPGGPSPHHARGHSARDAEPPPTGVSDQQHGPFAPLGPESPNSFAAVASGPGGGAAFVLWCALLVGLVICAARTLRRNVLPPVVFAPTAFVSLLQRPG